MVNEDLLIQPFGVWRSHVEQLSVRCVDASAGLGRSVHFTKGFIMIRVKLLKYLHGSVTILSSSFCGYVKAFSGGVPENIVRECIDGDRHHFLAGLRVEYDRLARTTVHK